MKKLPLKKILYKVNLPRLICNHIVGKEHTIEHRLFVGSCIMIVGVLLSKVTFDNYIHVHLFTDMVGYGIHGIGLTPWIELMSKAE